MMSAREFSPPACAATPKSAPTVGNRPDFLDPVREAQIVAKMRESIAALNEDDALLSDMVEGETQLFEIIDRLLERRRDAEVIIDGIEAAVARLNERKRRAEEGADRDRALIEQALTIAGFSQAVVRPTATLSMSKRPTALVITEESDVPARFWKAGKPTLDRTALMQALRDNTPIPGATLSNGAPSLTIRVK